MSLYRNDPLRTADLLLAIGFYLASFGSRFLTSYKHRQISVLVGVVNGAGIAIDIWT